MSSSPIPSVAFWFCWLFLSLCRRFYLDEVPIVIFAFVSPAFEETCHIRSYCGHGQRGCCLFSPLGFWWFPVSHLGFSFILNLFLCMCKKVVQFHSSLCFFGSTPLPRFLDFWNFSFPGNNSKVLTLMYRPISFVCNLVRKSGDDSHEWDPNRSVISAWQPKRWKKHVKSRNGWWSEVGLGM